MLVAKELTENLYLSKKNIQKPKLDSYARNNKNNSPSSSNFTGWYCGRTDKEIGSRGAGKGLNRLILCL